MTKAPAFQFYYKEWLTGTKGMSRVERDIYLTLLIFQFDTDGKLPYNKLELMRIADVKGKKEIESFNYVLEKKFVLVEGFYQNKKMADVIEENRAYRLKQKENALKGGRPRNPSVSSGFPNNNPPQTPIPTSTSSNNTKDKHLITPPSQAMVEKIFVDCGLSESEGEMFFKHVKGTRGWENLNSWVDYTMSVVKKKLIEKNGEPKDPNAPLKMVH